MINKILPRRKSAFSLIEMAIVILVIAIIIVGVIGGSQMIRSATINGARSFTVKSSVSHINGLIAWYETSLKESIKNSESYNGAQISNWFDISPQSLVAQRYDITPGSVVGQKNVLSRTASSTLTYKDKGINDVPSLYFSGGNLTLSSFYQGSLTQSTVFLVFRPASSGTTLFDSNSAGNDSSISISSNAVNINAGSAVSTSNLSNSAAFVNGADYVIAVYFNGSECKAYVNNAETSAGNASVNCGTNALTGLTIGSNKSGGSAFSGLISEVIIYNHPLQIQERRDIFKYLSYKYKISVSGI